MCPECENENETYDQICDMCENPRPKAPEKDNSDKNE